MLLASDAAREFRLLPARRRARLDGENAFHGTFRPFLAVRPLRVIRTSEGLAEPDFQRAGGRFVGRRRAARVTGLLS